MSETILAATRKGLLTYAASSGGWSLAGSAFDGEPATAVLDDARDGTLYVALNLGHFGIKLHRSDDRGRTWNELAPPAYAPVADVAAAKTAPSVELIWTLEAGGADEPGRLWAGTIPGGLFTSTDRGDTWSLVESLWNEPLRAEWFGGGYDQPGLHSVCVDPRDSARLTVGVSCGGVWTSTDRGATWQLGGTGLRADYVPPNQKDDRAIQDVHRLAPCVADPQRLWCQHHNGIFRSDDGGANFTEITGAGPSQFGFGVAAHPTDPDIAWFVPAIKDECRIPVDRKFVVTRTRDGGESFEVLDDGLPDGPAFDLVYRHALAVDARGERLVIGSTTGNLWVGDGGGDRWQAVSAHLPPINQVIWAAEN